MKFFATMLSFVLIVAYIAIGSYPTEVFAKIYHLTILHTNDHKGHFAKFSWDGIPDIGGMAAQSTLINIVRAEVEQAGGHVLLLSAGDVNIGTPESDLLYAEPDFKLMKMLGYDAMTLGNQEFDNPREILSQQRAWAGFPFLSANLVKQDTGERLEFVEPYIIRESDGLRVAIFGLTTGATPTAATYAKDMDARNEIEVAQTLVQKLHNEADLVIALTHIGVSLCSERRPDEAAVAQAVPGIAVIVAGGSGIAFEKPEIIGDTLIVQAGSYGVYVGRLDITIDSEAEKVIDYAYNLIPVNLKKAVTYHDQMYYLYAAKGYVEDIAALALMQPYLAKTEELLTQPVGEALVKLDGAIELVTSQETNLANLTTDAMRSKTGAEIAFANGGGIQREIAPGPITYRNILQVHPWGDTLVLLDMTGAQIMEMLNYAATLKFGEGGFLHVSGLTWTIKRGVPSQVLVSGMPIESESVYKVVMNSFIAGGGDGYTMLKELPQFDTGFTQASALREYIMKLGTVAPKVEGRLKIIE